MEQAITEGLADLNFEDVKFSIAFEKSGSYSANGSDDVEFMISFESRTAGASACRSSLWWRTVQNYACNQKCYG